MAEFFTLGFNGPIGAAAGVLGGSYLGTAVGVKGLIAPTAMAVGGGMLALDYLGGTGLTGKAALVSIGTMVLIDSLAAGFLIESLKKLVGEGKPDPAAE
jgi:hypothetical protein